MVERGESRPGQAARRPTSVVALGALALALGCGGRSLSTEKGNGDSDTGGSDTGTGGSAGSAGSPRGGSGGTSGTAGNGAGGASVGGQAGGGGTTCPDGTFTTIVGTVRDPAGQTPLYNVFVYVPSGPLEPMAEGIECDRCIRIDPSPLSTALTDVEGRFTLYLPESGPTVQLVMQVGKWRREVSVGPIVPCATNEVDDRDLLRLPASRVEGHLPRIAAVTGREDAVECLLRRIGISDQEFTTETGGGAVNLFVGCDAGEGTGANHFATELGAAPFSRASELFGDSAKLASYDLVLLGCEGASCGTEKDPYVTNLQRYADTGGRLFLDHKQSYWLEHGPEAWQVLAEFAGEDDAVAPPARALIDRTFPKGYALSEWLVDIGASRVVGEVEVLDPSATLLSVTPPIQRWLYGPTVLQMTMHTPVDGPIERQCGRLTFSDFHAHGGADLSRGEIGFPDGCAPGPLSAQEATLVFQLFDIPVCVTSGVDPVPPRP